MNYLAHLHLGGQAPAQLLGSLYGDFVKGPLAGHFPQATENAIRLHRSIDAFTDSHALVRQALARFSDQKRRYAGIALNMFFDHCLARDWEVYAEGSLEDYSQRIYGLLKREPQLPEALSQVAPLMISQDWLCAYRDFAMIGHGLTVISRRLSRSEVLEGLYEELQAQYEPLSADFKAFYPVLRSYAQAALITANDDDPSR